MLKNFLWQREDEPQNMLSYLFIYVNLCYGITFTLFDDSKVVKGSPFAMYSLPPFLWGSACLLLVAFTLFAIYDRSEFLGSKIGLLGVSVWGYGLTLYLLSGSWFAAAAVYLPQLLFWVFWGIGVKRFYNRESQTTRA